MPFGSLQLSQLLVFGRNSNGIVALESWEPSKTRIVAMHHRLVFDCKRSNMCIRYQLRAAVDSIENVLQVGKMVRSRIKGSDVGVLKPTFYPLQGL